MFCIIQIDFTNLITVKIGGTFMKSKSYHHGDLRNALIETGIDVMFFYKNPLYYDFLFSFIY